MNVSPTGKAPFPRKIVVMHLIHTMAYGGIETAVLNWLSRLDRDRFTIHLVCFANPGNTEEPFVNIAAQAGFEVEKILWNEGKPILRAAKKLSTLINTHQVDILHTHNCYADVIGLCSRFMTRVKLVTTVYVWAKFDLKRNIIQLINKFVVRFFDIVSAHCEDTFTKTARFIPAKRLRLLICGFEFDTIDMPADERERRRKEYGLDNDHIVLANIARFYPEKAQDSLLRCFKEIVSQESNVHLWMLGVGPLEKHLKNLCTELELNSKVTFIGFVDNLFEVLPLIDIQVHPSHMEGVPLSICTGMAAGLPIVASNVGGIKEVLRHEKTGILVPENDEKQFVSQVLKLVKDADTRSRLGAAARHFIENDYSLGRAVKEVEKVYYEVMQ